MENTTSASKSGLQYAILFAVIMIFELVIGYVLNIDPQTNKLYGTLISVLNYFILPFTLIYVACFYFKTKVNFGFISISQCIKIGISICIVAGLIYGLFSAAFNFIFPEYFDEILKKMQSIMRQDNPQLSSQQVELSISMIKKLSNPLIAIPLVVIMYAFIGLIHSLIIGVILKKDANKSL
jgi:hypothetical protein